MTSLTRHELLETIKREGDLSIFLAHGLVCMARRRPVPDPLTKYAPFHWCGYVGVLPGHPAYGKHYDECLCLYMPLTKFAPIAVHGGLTFADALNALPEEAALLDGLGRLWFFGFDCAHNGDVAKLQDLERDYQSTLPDPTYKDLPFVIAECVKLAAHLARMPEAPR